MKYILLFTVGVATILAEQAARPEEALQVADTKHHKYYPSYRYHSYGHPSYSSYGSGYRWKRDISELETPVEEALEGAETKHYKHYPSYGYRSYGHPSYSSYGYGHPSYSSYDSGYRWKRDLSELEAPVEEALEGAETKNYKHYPSYGYRSYGHPSYSSYSYGHPSYSSYGSGYRWKRDLSEAEPTVEEVLEGAETKHYKHYPSYKYRSHYPSYGYGHPLYGSSYGRYH
ncbi:prisilkin-39-like [Artemia franciscana]|uniref:prisilkin-39-like n=1 Tax=Artemia franciscana TaxID=6661 RepID=UPI0032DA8F09